MINSSAHLGMHYIDNQAAGRRASRGRGSPRSPGAANRGARGPQGGDYFYTIYVCMYVCMYVCNGPDSSVVRAYGLGSGRPWVQSSPQ